MVASNGSGRCERAEAYYYDYLEEESRSAVPPSVLEHIRGCQYCQRRLGGLREKLSMAPGEGPKGPAGRDRRLIGELERHFELLGERLTCGRVQPFLAGLVDPAVKIRIPTPITVHVDNCPDCARDLESLRDGGQIAERADSGVITVCTIKEGGRTASERTEGAGYQDYPIEVKVLGGRREGAVDGGGTPVRRPRFKPFKRAAIFAAALIPLAIMFSLTSPSATGLTVGEVGRATAGLQYTRILRYDREGNKGLEVWVGRRDGIVVWQENGVDTIYNLREDEKTVVGPNGAAALGPLPAAERESVEGWIRENVELHLMKTFRGMEMTSELIEAAGGVDVYEIQSESLGGSGPLWKCTMHVDPMTNRLQRRVDYQWDRVIQRLRPNSTYTYESKDAAEFERRVRGVHSPR